MTTTNELNAIFFGNGTASHCWRIDGVANRINAQTPDAIYVTDWQKWNKNLAGANLVILEMLASPDIVDICHEQGAKVIWEADDAMIDSYGDERKNLQKLNTTHRQVTIDVLNKVDAITVTNEVLKKNYARFTDKPIYVIPNYIDFDWYGRDKLTYSRITDEVRIGWFGSQGHLEDLKMVVPALKEVLETYPQVKFVYCGFGGMSSEKKITQIGWGEDVFAELPRDRREFYVGVREDYWPMKHRTLDLDIGICPLIEDEFNWNKTPIKWMEFGLLGVPSVVSPTLYSATVEDGKDALIARDTKEWIEKLQLLVRDVELRKRIGNAAKERIENEFDLEKHWKKQHELYRLVALG